MATLKTQDMMAGYAMLERPRRNITREGDARSFEVFDTESLTKETITIAENKPKVSKKKKPSAIPKSIMDTVEPKGLPEGTTKVVRDIPPEYKPETEPDDVVTVDDNNEYRLPEVRAVVKVFSDITEITIDAVHVFMDDNVVCIFMDKDEKTKLKPKKGLTMDIEALGRRVSVYSPGVYVPIEPFGCDMVFLLVQNPEEE